jgi:hypothetical protein
MAWSLMSRDLPNNSSVVTSLSTIQYGHELFSLSLLQPSLYYPTYLQNSCKFATCSYMMLRSLERLIVRKNLAVFATIIRCTGSWWHTKYPRAAGFCVVALSSTSDWKSQRLRSLQERPKSDEVQTQGWWSKCDPPLKPDKKTHECHVSSYIWLA